MTNTDTTNTDTTNVGTTSIDTSKLDANTFSMKTVPETWIEAEGEAGGNDNRPLKKDRPVNGMPIREDADALTGVVAAFAMSVITGVVWYLYESNDVLTTPWLAVPVGVLIAVAVRLGTGPNHSDVRATISLIFYILTVFVTAFFIESRDYLIIFGERPGFKELQTELVRDRLTQPMTMVAWVVGMIANVQTGLALNARKVRRWN